MDFTKREQEALKAYINANRLEIWEYVYKEIKRSRVGGYICLLLLEYIQGHADIRYYYEFEEDYVLEQFPEFLKYKEIYTKDKTEAEIRCDGWFGELSAESKRIRLKVVKEIIKKLKKDESNR